jgi:hypothetical protein
MKELTTELPPLLPQSECFKFLEDEAGYTPAQGYVEYCSRREEKGLHHPLYYASTTITSGGYRRYDNISTGEAIEQNSLLAQKIIWDEIIKKTGQADLIVLPSELGKVSDWQQIEYLEFWLYIIRAIEPNSAKVLEDQYFHSSQVFEDISARMHSTSRDEAKQAYIDFVREYLGLMASPRGKTLLTSRWQAPVVIPIFDNMMSLGCSVEWYLADKILPEWGFYPEDSKIKKEIKEFQQMGAMVVGVTQEMIDEDYQHSKVTWQEYYQAKD